MVSNTYGGALSGSVRVQVNVRPVVDAQPQTVLSSVGGTATFRAEVSGSGVLAFQWQRLLSGGAWTNVDGATQKVLTLRALTAADKNSSYRLVVQSAYGTVTSAEAALTLVEPKDVRIVSDPVLGNNEALLLQSGAIGKVLRATAADTSGSASLSYKWRKDGVVIGTGTAPLGSGGSYAISYALPVVGNDSDGVYDVVVDNGAGFAISRGVVLSVDPHIDAVQVPAVVTPGDATKLSVTVRKLSDTAVYTYEWRRDGVAISDGSGISGSKSDTLLISAATTAMEGVYQVRVRNSASGWTLDSAPQRMSVVSPVQLTGQPKSANIAEGASLEMQVAATGGGALKYQWIKDGVELAQETSSKLSRASAGVGDAGLYQVRVSNALGFVLSDLATVAVTPKLGVQLSAPESVALGGGVNLVAQAVGAGSDGVSYKWYRDGVPLLGVSGDQYRINSATLSDAGRYSVSVTRLNGSETASSNVVTLDVKRVPLIVVAPVSRTVVDGAGTEVIFSVVVRSDTPVSYQWSRNGVELPAATSSMLKLGAGTSANAGTYSVRILNAVGSVEASAKLTVMAAGVVLTAAPTAGSSDSGLAQASWWVYWVDATAETPANDRNGYWLLERATHVDAASGKTVVTPGRSLWVWGWPQNPGRSLSSYEWAAEDQVVQDGLASDRAEFSVVASRVPAASYTLGGRVGTSEEASIYGAPESVSGAYDGDIEPLQLSLVWDAEMVAEFEGEGSPANLRELVELVKAALVQELGKIAGE